MLTMTEHPLNVVGSVIYIVQFIYVQSQSNLKMHFWLEPAPVTPSSTSALLTGFIIVSDSHHQESVMSRLTVNCDKYHHSMVANLSLLDLNIPRLTTITLSIISVPPLAIDLRYLCHRMSVVWSCTILTNGFPQVPCA